MLPLAQQAQLKKMMIHDEGYCLKIYKDSMGNETLGIGHLCSNGFSDQVVQLIFDEDWQAAESWLMRHFAFYDFLDPVRKLALINMRFNLGPDHFLQFQHFIDAMSKKNYQDAAQAILSSLWSKQLPSRTERIAYMILHGEFPKEYGLNA